MCRQWGEQKLNVHKCKTIVKVMPENVSLPAELGLHKVTELSSKLQLKPWSTSQPMNRRLMTTEGACKQSLIMMCKDLSDQRMIATVTTTQGLKNLMVCSAHPGSVRGVV